MSALVWMVLALWLGTLWLACEKWAAKPSEWERLEQEFGKDEP